MTLTIGTAGPMRIGKDPFYGGFTGSIAGLEVLTEAVPDTLVPALANAAWPAQYAVAGILVAVGIVLFFVTMAINRQLGIRGAGITDPNHLGDAPD